MSVIGNIIRSLYDIIGNLGLTIFLTAFIVGIITLISQALLTRNNVIKAKCLQEIHLIKKQKLTPTEEIMAINNIYKKEKYLFAIPELLQILTILLNLYVFTTILNYSEYIIEYRTTGPQSFLFIENIFAMEWTFVIPIICGLLPLLINNLFNLKYLITSEAIADYILAIVLIFSYAVYSKIFTPLYVIFIFGKIVFSIVPKLVFYKQNKQIEQLTKEFQANQNTENFFSPNAEM